MSLLLSFGRFFCICVNETRHPVQLVRVLGCRFSVQAIRQLVANKKVSLLFDEFTDDQGNSLIALIAQLPEHRLCLNPGFSQKHQLCVFSLVHMRFPSGGCAFLVR